MHGRLLVALAHVQAGNAWKLLNKIRQIVYSLYQAKEITKKYHTKWILYLWIPKAAKHLNLIDYYLILWIK